MKIACRHYQIAANIWIFSKGSMSVAGALLHL